MDLQNLGFKRTVPEETGRPPCDPADLIKLYLYGYLNRTRSSRQRDREANRKVEVLWLIRRLAPDFKTIADFRRDNRKAIQQVCRNLELFSGDMIAIDGSKFKAVNNKGRNFTERRLKKIIKKLEEDIDRYIVVDTDSPVLREGIQSEYPDTQLIDRPEHLAHGTTPMNEVLKYDVGQVESNIYVQTHSTSPLLRALTIRDALRTFQKSFPDMDSLFGVTKLQTRLWDSEGRPLHHDPDNLLRTQDLEPVFEENSCLYLFEHKTFLERGNRIGKTPLLFEIDSKEAVDLDNEADFRLSELVLQLRSDASN